MMTDAPSSAAAIDAGRPAAPEPMTTTSAVRSQCLSGFAAPVSPAAIPPSATAPRPAAAFWIRLLLETSGFLNSVLLICFRSRSIANMIGSAYARVRIDSTADSLALNFLGAESAEVNHTRAAPWVAVRAHRPFRAGNDSCAVPGALPRAVILH